MQIAAVTWRMETRSNSVFPRYLSLVSSRDRTAGVAKRVRSTSLYYSKQCDIVVKPRSDRICCTVVCLMTHACSRTLRKQYQCELGVVENTEHDGVGAARWRRAQGDSAARERISTGRQARRSARVVGLGT